VGVQIMQQAFHGLAKRIPHCLRRIKHQSVSDCVQSLPPLQWLSTFTQHNEQKDNVTCGH